MQPHPAFGALAHEHKDHLHVFADAFAYASPWVFTQRTARPTGVLLFTVDGAPFTVEVAGRRQSLAACALAPNVVRGLDARGVRLVSLNIAPTAAAFPAFRHLPAPGLLALDRRALSGFDDFIAALFTGTAMRLPGAAARFDALVAAAIAQFPRCGAHDDRPAHLRALLAGIADDDQVLPQLSQRLGLSYHRSSHLFSDAMGIPLRSFVTWRRHRRLYEPLLGGMASLTTVAHDAGLPDSAYLSRIYQRWYGQRPSFARSNSVQVFFDASAYPDLPQK